MLGEQGVRNGANLCDSRQDVWQEERRWGGPVMAGALRQALWQECAGSSRESFPQALAMSDGA